MAMRSICKMHNFDPLSSKSAWANSSYTEENLRLEGMPINNIFTCVYRMPGFVFTFHVYLLTFQCIPESGFLYLGKVVDGKQSTGKVLLNVTFFV